MDERGRDMSVGKCEAGGQGGRMGTVEDGTRRGGPRTSGWDLGVP